MIALAVPGHARAQDGRIYHLIEGHLQQRTNAVLALMGYSQTPDVTSGSLKINDASTGNPSFHNTAIGGGFVVSDSFPIYLEGTAAYSRYDPRFVATDGTTQRAIPTRWNSAIGTAGVGWNFQLTDNWSLRPIGNFSIGRVASDTTLGSWYIDHNTDADISFLKKGTLKTNGFGESLMVVYAQYQESHEIDMELRYTNILLKSYGGFTPAIEGKSRNENASLWSRWRAPTGMHALDRPVRYIFEFAHTQYFGDDARVLGFNHLTSFGTGLELDTSKYNPLWISRARAVVRYVYGPGVSGVSLGLAVTFD